MAISGQKMKDLGQLVRGIEDRKLKMFMVYHWNEMNNKDDEWATKLIDAICAENAQEVNQLFAL